MKSHLQGVDAGGVVTAITADADGALHTRDTTLSGAYDADTDTIRATMVGVSEVVIDNAVVNVNETGVGDPTDALVTDSTASATLVALMKGLLAQLQPSADWAQVTPSDSTSFSKPTRAILVGGAGNVAAVKSGGAAVTIKTVAAGSIIPIAAIRINATNTTATDITALF